MSAEGGDDIGGRASRSRRSSIIAKRLAGAAGYVSQLQRGDRAMLRRLRGRYSEVPPEPFWRIVERYEIPEGDREDRFWMSVLPLMVQHAHQRGSRPGRVLCRAGVSPARLERWLRRDCEGAWAEADRLLSQVDQPFDWVQFGFLLYYWDHRQYGEKNRRRLARDYFLSPECRRSSTT